MTNGLALLSYWPVCQTIKPREFSLVPPLCMRL